MLALSLLVPAGLTFAQTPGFQEALDYLEENAPAHGLSHDDFSDLVVSDHYVSRHNGVTHLYLQQRFDGIPVHNAIMSMAFLENGEVLSAAHRFVTDLGRSIVSSDQNIDAVEAARIAAGHVGLDAGGQFTVEGARSEHQINLSEPGIAQDTIPVNLLYHPLETGEVRLAWMVGIYTLDAQHYWSITVDAATGQILREDDLVVHDHWAEELSVVEQGIAEAPSLLQARTVAPPVVQPRSAGSAQYRVYEMPIESPSHAGNPLQDNRTVAMNPADPIASPLGWHDTGNVSYTITRGNNVHSYTDTNASNSPDPGSQPDGGPDLVFDFPLDLGQAPATYRDAVVTNLFYWNNIIHDVSYRYGFDEPSGNFQVNNFGLGGLGNDDVRAEAQDGGGTNNANFFTPPDGSRPRMQMYIWTSPSGATLTVNEPEAIAGEYSATGASFGPPLTADGVTGTVVQAIDDDGLTTVCVPIDNAAEIQGNIAMIDRGDCTFVSKIMRVQEAGAIGVIIANNVSGNPIVMGGDGPDVVIPSIMISLANSNTIKPHLPDGVVANIGQGIPDRDSDLDAGVIVHEYGHGINHRLTGGPNTTQCLRNTQRGDEGWADWWALMLTGGDVDSRGIGTYLRFQPPTGPGIRPARYSTSMAVNPYTFADISNLSVPHGVGFVWASMLWDMTQLLIDDHGYDPDLYSGTGGNNLALQLVMDGLKLQPCSPGFVDSRDAILAADVALTEGENQCRIWEAFSRRGLGYSAVQGHTESTSGVVEAFDMPFTCQAIATGEDPTGSIRLEPVFPNPAVASANVTFTLPASTEIRLEVFDILGRRVAMLADGTVQAGTHELRWNTTSVGAGVYVLRLTAGERQLVQRVTVFGGSR